jgi:carbamate kinase
LAEAVGADIFMVLTDVDRVYLNYGKKGQRGLSTLRLEKARQYLKNHAFPSGSMEPKVSACVGFIEYGGERAIITSLDQASAALEGRAGTHLLPDE